MNQNVEYLAGQGDLSRRHFLKKSSLMAGTAIAAANLPFVVSSHAAGDLPIKVGIIGCGGRGSGAGRQVVSAAPGVEIVAIGDIFPESIDKAKKNFKETKHFFHGFDAYKKVLEIPEINYVILATPPGFRPMHFTAAVEAGKHIFAEKPVGVDPAGVKAVMAAGEKATAKKLCVVAGSQRRHQAPYIESIKRIQDGALGEIVYLKAFWNQGAIWHRGDNGDTEMEKQLRNWYHYLWLCGDHIVEQHLHNIDVCNWIMKNEHPIKAYAGIGGRQALGDKSGQIFDHFAVEFEYANGVRMFSQCRQITGCDSAVDEHAVGVAGSAYLTNSVVKQRSRINFKLKSGETWQPTAVGIDPYVQEHADLISAIRTGNYVNETKHVAESTLTCIMGREATYTGKAVEWDKLLACDKSSMPEKLEWGPAPKVVPPMPGKYTLCS